MQILLLVASYWVPPSPPLVHLNLSSQYQEKKHNGGPLLADGLRHMLTHPLKAWSLDERRCLLICHWLLLVVTRSLSDFWCSKRSPGSKVSGMPSSTIGLSEGSFLTGLVAAYSYPSSNCTKDTMCSDTWFPEEHAPRPKSPHSHLLRTPWCLPVMSFATPEPCWNIDAFQIEAAGPWQRREHLSRCGEAYVHVTVQYGSLQQLHHFSSPHCWYQKW